MKAGVLLDPGELSPRVREMCERLNSLTAEVTLAMTAASQMVLAAGMTEPERDAVRRACGSLRAVGRIHGPRGLRGRR